MVTPEILEERICEITGGKHELTRSSLDDLYKLYIVRDYLNSEGMAEARGSNGDAWIDVWMQHLQNEDGSTGPHWSLQQTTDVMKSKNYRHDPKQFYAAMNMMYSDYYGAAKQFNNDSPQFYAALADAFLCDKDAGPMKLRKYYRAVAK